MPHQSLHKPIAWTFSALLFAATVARFAQHGPPFLARPRTVVDRVSRTPHETRDAILVLEQAAKRMPPGASVTAFRPHHGQSQNDSPTFLTAVGILHRQFVLPPFVASPSVSTRDLPQFVVAVGAPFDHADYDLVERFETGALYKVRR